VRIEIDTPKYFGSGERKEEKRAFIIQNTLKNHKKKKSKLISIFLYE
jgi:hypothetical protein